MSNIGKLPVTIKEGTKVEKEIGRVNVVGPKGELSFKLPREIDIKIEDNIATIVKKKDNRRAQSFYGLVRTLLANSIQGVNEGYEKKLELVGVGYRAKVEGQNLVLNVGLANSVKISPPEGIAFQVKDNTITVSGIDKTIVGDVASKVRKVRPPEPYKGKGIKYQGEHIRRKAGKAAKGAGAA